MTATSSDLVSAYRERLASVRERISAAEQRAGTAPGAVTLVGVSKTVGRDDVDAAYAAGLRDFGENRVQDLREKLDLHRPDDMRVHLIGSLQTNKARQVVGHVALIHSLDRGALADELQRRAAALETVLPVLIQVNIAREEQKHGCLVEDLRPLLDLTLAQPNLALRGFMTMAPLVATPEEARPVFAAMRQLRDELARDYPSACVHELSMGMTNDFVEAIEEGATIVRVGRAIFAPAVKA